MNGDSTINEDDIFSSGSEIKTPKQKSRKSNIDWKNMRNSMKPEVK